LEAIEQIIKLQKKKEDLQSQYPVILVDFKGVDGRTPEEMRRVIC
jgi:hypothetical protein